MCLCVNEKGFLRSLGVLPLLVQAGRKCSQSHPMIFVSGKIVRFPRSHFYLRVKKIAFNKPKTKKKWGKYLFDYDENQKEESIIVAIVIYIYILYSIQPTQTPYAQDII